MLPLAFLPLLAPALAAPSNPSSSAAAPSSSSSASSDSGVKTSQGFHILLIPSDSDSSPSASPSAIPIPSGSANSTTTNSTSPAGNLRTISGIHTGAGQSRAIAGAPSDSETVFYRNGTEGGDTFVTDSGAQGFPMSLFFSDPEENVQGGGQGGNGTLPVGEDGDDVEKRDDDESEDDDEIHPADITVSGATKGLKVSDDAEITHPDGGSFYVCDSYVPYYRTNYPVFSWSPSDEAPEGCEAVKVVSVCEELEELPEDAIGNHDGVEDVKCFVDDQAALEASS